MLVGQALTGAAGEYRFGQFQRRELALADRFAQLVEQVAQGAQQRFASLTLVQRLAGGCAEQAVDRRQANTAHS